MDQVGGATGDALHDAFAGLIDGLRAAEESLRTVDPPLPEPDRLDGYRWIFSLLAVGLDAYVWADTGRPRFVDIVGPHRKWGGDNSDAFYQLAPIDPARTYRVRCVPGDAGYLSLTVYGGPDDGRYSERIVGTLNDRTAKRNPDGSFDLVLSPDRPADGDAVNWLRLEPDAVVAITRDYLADPRAGRRAVWSIEAADPPAAPTRTAADLARRFAAATTWLAEQVQICPVRVEPVNEVQEPYPVPTATFGWAAGDAAYAMGSFELGPGEALVIDGSSPGCAFWNLCLWNPFLHTYDDAYDRVTINGHQVVPVPGDGADDGRWRIVVAADDPGHPNWVSTQGRTSGLLWFRWFLPEVTPERPTCRVVAVADVADLAEVAEVADAPGTGADGTPEDAR
jgi:hypothetical protein